MDIKDLITQVGSLATPTVESLGYELIETEYLNEQGRWVLRLYIDKPGGGINLNDCEKVSRAVSALLDVEDVVPGKYNLEVSSPGLERPLRRVEDFERYAGSVVKVRTYHKIGDRRNFKGVLQGVEKENINLLQEGKVVKIPIKEVFKARLQEASMSGGK